LIRKLITGRRLSAYHPPVGVPRRRRRPALAPLAVSVLAAAAIGGCAETFRELGPTPAVAESHANEMLDALVARFTHNEFSPRYDRARLRLIQAALVPSRVFDDTSVWSAEPSPTTRVLLVSGEMDDKVGRYRLESRPALTPIARTGDTRHTMQLRSVEPDVFRWDTNVDMGIGPITAAEVSNLWLAVFRAADGRSEAQLRDDYRAAFPRATAAFGRGFAIDSLHTTPAPGGGTSVVITAGFHADAMRAAYPALADYLEKYLGPAKYHFALADKEGTPLFDADGRDRTLTVRYRLHDGKLASLNGPPRPWPDTLRLTSDVTMKVKVFHVGFHQLVTDFVISNVGHDRAFTIVAQREPQWELPLVTERLLRTPLRRPFTGQGSIFVLSVRDSAGGQTIFTRRTRFDVQESTIARFLGSLAGRLLGDLGGAVEEEEDRFFRDGLVAMQADLKSVARGWRPRDDGGAEKGNATKP
jgi:hypothetical protein